MSMKLLLLPLLLSACAALASTTCDSGRQQSPIDITTTSRQKLPALTFDYRAAPLKLADDGHTVRVRFGNGSQLLMGAQRYTLQQFHFHTPGGDRIAGEEFPMAAHLLHKSQSGQLLALVVLFRLGAENPLLTSLLPLIPAQADGDHTLAGIQIDARDLLPASRGYYRYSGSLTAAPCTEGVDWLVMKQPLELSAAQLARYRKRFADNARAVQPLHQRVVQESL
jgi:carbonic anhydrase